jgi:hypothetical protein
MSKLSHTPMRPVRDLLAEQVFASEWLSLMGATLSDFDYDGPENGEQLSHIMQYLPGPITDRHSKIAASIIVWLGTNCGLAFLMEARRLMNSPTRIRYPFLAQWSHENTRHPCVNQNIRLIEHLLATEYHSDVFSPFGQTPVVPDLSVDDYDAAECLMRWLSTKDGLAFVAECERKIKVQNEVKHLGLSARSVETLGIRL